MVNNLLGAKRNLLKRMWVLLAAICVMEVIAFKRAGEISFSGYMFFLVALPFFLFGALNLALMSGKWLEHGAALDLFVAVKRFFFWTLVLAYTAVSIMIVWYFR
jgi:hypothetical protein